MLRHGTLASTKLGRCLDPEGGLAGVPENSVEAAERIDGAKDRVERVLSVDGGTGEEGRPRVISLASGRCLGR
jgi:hypothetical protein